MTNTFAFDASGASDDADLVEEDLSIPESLSVLDQLKAVIDKKVERPEFTVEIPDREGLALRLSPNITFEQINNWRNRSGANSRDGMDGLKFACHVIAGTTRAIIINGNVVEGDKGNRLTFASQELIDMVGADRPINAVRRLIAVDPVVQSITAVILEKAGWGEDVDETVVDPTQES